MRSLTSWSQHG
jgi:hypothetical protein